MSKNYDNNFKNFNYLQEPTIKYLQQYFKENNKIFFAEILNLISKPPKGKVQFLKI